MGKWISFDLDGTLIQNPFEKWVFPEIERLVSSNNNSNINIVKEMVTEHERLMLSKEYVAAYNWDNILQKLLKKFNILIDIDIERLVKKYSYIPKIYLLDAEIIHVLKGLKGKGYSLAVITNGYYKY